jgi:release factor glutamine methyltransferase
MTFRGCLAQAKARLDEAYIPEAELESRLLLRHVAKLTELELVLGYEDEVGPDQEEEYRRLLQRCIAGEPSAYILGKREFYGLEFQVSPAVLIPRPETELLVERALVLAKNYDQPLIADIGTGSGAIAVSLAKHLTQTTIYATDTSEPALNLARANAERHGVAERIIFHRGDLLEALSGPVDIIVANLPYVPTGNLYHLFEPRLALDGGSRGLDLIARFCPKLPGWLRSGGSVLLEVGQGQDEKVAEMLKDALPSSQVSIFDDLAGIPRVVQATVPVGSY